MTRSNNSGPVLCIVFIDDFSNVPRTSTSPTSSSSDATQLLRRARLRYLGSLHQPWASDLWPVLRADAVWIQQCHEDLLWIWQQLRRSSNLPDPRQDHQTWQQLWRQQPRRWKGLIKRAFSHDLLQQQIRQGVVTFHSRLQSHLVDAKLLYAQDLVTLPDPPSQPRLHGCMRCVKAFATKQGLHAHLCRPHGRISHIRYLFDGTQCPHCLHEYFTVEKLYNHLYHNMHCRQHLERARMTCHPAPGRGSSHAQEQARRHDGLAPVEQAAGPHLSALHRLDKYQIPGT